MENSTPDTAVLRRLLDDNAVWGRWWITGVPWGDELSIHCGPSEDPHVSTITVGSFDVMSEQFRSTFDGIDSDDVEEVGRGLLRLAVAAVNALPALLDRLDAQDKTINDLEAFNPLVNELGRHHIPWSQRTFGEGRRTLGIIKHIRKELDEIARNPTDVTEWIDVVILALDGAWRAGNDATAVSDALYEKLALIRTRTYPKPTSEDEPSEHDRVGESHADAQAAEITRLTALAGTLAEACRESREWINGFRVPQDWLQAALQIHSGGNLIDRLDAALAACGEEKASKP